MPSDNWSPTHDQIVDLISAFYSSTGDRIEPNAPQLPVDATSASIINLVEQLTPDNIDSFHRWREAYFNLLFHSVVHNSYDLFSGLIRKGADPTLANDKGTNVLHLLMKRGLIQWAEELLTSPKIKGEEAKVKFLNQGTAFGWTPLMAAADGGQLEACKWLIKNGAQVNMSMSTGWTAMHSAAKKNIKDIVALLLDNKGNKNILSAHRDFGRNLKVEDVTTDDDIIALLEKYK